MYWRADLNTRQLELTQNSGEPVCGDRAASGAENGPVTPILPPIATAEDRVDISSAVAVFQRPGGILADSVGCHRDGVERVRTAPSPGHDSSIHRRERKSNGEFEF